MTEVAADPASGDLPLSGVRVVELAQMIAGPEAGWLLAEYGASVIKVEPPGGDGSRPLSSAGGDPDESAMFRTYNAGKHCVRMDLKDPDDAAAVWELIGSADVLIESASPGTMDRLGFGYEAVRARNPGLVYTSVSGFGWTDHGRTRKGIDLLAQAEGGIMSCNGPRGGDPLKVGFQIIDAASGHAIAHGILAALYGRSRTGRGRWVRASLYGVAVNLQAAQLAEYVETGRQAPRQGNSAALSAPADLYECSDGFIVLSAFTAAQWTLLTDLIGRPDLRADPRFADNALRVENRTDLNDQLNDALRTRTVDHWLEVLVPGGILAAQVKDYATIVNEAPRYIPGLIEQIDGRGFVRNPIDVGVRPPVRPPRTHERVPGWSGPDRDVASTPA
jgi:crotonobetainyl-CoA:carnitine CoA-transferase CaiB-like acyl-CoA transferase